MKLVYDRHDDVADWVAERTGSIIAKPYVAIGATRDGVTFTAGAVFNNYNGSNIDISLASEGGVTRDTLREIYHYCFIRSKVNRITASTRRANKRMRKALPKLGFEFEAVCKSYFGSAKRDDAFVYALFKDRADRWLKNG